MTLFELIRTWLRHWPVVLLGIACTVSLGLWAKSDPGVYFTRTTIVFFAPSSSLYPNSLKTQSDDIIVTAGVVAKRVTGPGQVSKFASPDVTLVGQGIRDGWSLRLPDTGGQWATNFATQRLILEIVSPSEEIVRERQTELVGRVQAELQDLQQAAGVAPINYITAAAAPETSIIVHVGGSRYRAVGMIGLLGIGVTGACVMLLERRRRRRLREPVVEDPAVEDRVRVLSATVSQR